MEHGFVGRTIDRIVADARVIRGASEAIVLVGIIVFGVSYFGFQHFHRERVAALKDRIAWQERLLAEYQTKLRGATPEEAATQIERLTTLLAEAQRSLSDFPIQLEQVAQLSREAAGCVWPPLAGCRP
jgi:hypothetical protein